MDRRIDPEAANAISVFKSLTTPEARSDTYRALVKDLRWDECLVVADLIYARFHFDILSSLPLELVARIATYLDLHETVLFRRVSKKWKWLFSDPLTCSSSFRSHRSDANLDTSRSTWSQDYLRYSARNLAAMTGRPHSMAIYPTSPAEWGSANAVSYSSGVVAWICKTEVRLISLSSGMKRAFVAKNRQALVCVRASQTMVAALTTRGVCNVWRYCDGVETSVRLPSAQYRNEGGLIGKNFIVDDDMVAICFANSLSVVVWDLHNQQAREIKLCSAPFHMFVDATERALFILYLESAEGKIIDNLGCPSARLIGTKYSTTSGFPGKVSFSFNFPERCMFVTSGLAPSTCLTWSRTLVFKLNGMASSSTPHQHIDDAQFCVPKEYFVSVSYDNIKQTPDIRLYQNRFMMSLTSSVILAAMPNDLIYYICHSSGEQGVGVFNLRRGTGIKRSELFDIEVQLTQQPEDRSSFGASLAEASLVKYSFGDDQYFGILGEGIIKVWCFEKDIVMAGDIAMYRRLRAERVSARQQASRYEDRLGLELNEGC